MTRRIRIDDEALDELVEAAHWYEDRERGRGVSFSNEAFVRVEALSSFPDAGVPVHGVGGALLARQVRLLRYAYLVVYAVANDEIRVVALPMNDNCPATGPIDSSRSPRHARAAVGAQLLSSVIDSSAAAR